MTASGHQTCRVSSRLILILPKMSLTKVPTLDRIFPADWPPDKRLLMPELPELPPDVSVSLVVSPPLEVSPPLDVLGS